MAFDFKSQIAQVAICLSKAEPATCVCVCVCVCVCRVNGDVQ